MFTTRLLIFLAILAPFAASAARLEPVSVLVLDRESELPLLGARVQRVGESRFEESGPFGWATLALVGGRRNRIVVTLPGYQRLTLTLVDPKTIPGYLVAEMVRHQLQAGERWRHLGDRTLYSSSTLPRPRTYEVLPTIEVPATVKVKRSSDGAIIELDLEEYIRGVLPKEIGTTAPLEAIKAQAVAARSYAINYLKSHASICDTAACQVWGPTHYEKTDQAVNETLGQVAIYDGKIINAVFSAQCGGHTIDGNQPQSSKCGAWSSTPYLKGVPCWENKGSECGEVCHVTKFRDGYGCADPNNPGSNPNPDLCYDIWGHQRGLCQRGAMSMARCGKDYIEIVKHYYTGVEIANRPPVETDDAQLVAEEPPNAPVAPLTPFSVSWTVKNTGDTTWDKTKGYTWAFIEGESFGKPGYFTLSDGETIVPQAEKIWTVTLIAPPTPGQYRGYWQMRRGGTPFGDKVWVDLNVVSDGGDSDVIVGPGSDSTVPDDDGTAPTADLLADTTNGVDTNGGSGSSSGCRTTIDARRAESPLVPLIVLLLALVARRLGRPSIPSPRADAGDRA
ncbi:MAG: SpoIID/LytB domain-containing protein [Myxococcales bacterium]|nr:SpoIID/LytB domain-containing protein [Myxococcales bacterium]